MAGNILRLKPLEFAHVLDLNLNVTYVEIGPRTLILQDNQSVVYGPAPFVIIPPGHYCTVINPAKLPVPYGQQAELHFGHSVVRFNQEPFPLYPGEVLTSLKTDSKDYGGAIKKLPVVPAGKALKLEALQDFTDDKDVPRIAGDEWQIEGPCTYFPRPEVKSSGRVDSVVVSYMEALHLRAKRDLVDKTGNKRVTGEEWLHRGVGSYLPGVHEQVVKIVTGHTLTLNNALHMVANESLVDGIGKKRNASEEYLITEKESAFYIPEVGEEVVNEIDRVVLAKQQFCVVINPVNAEGHQELGMRELRKGECSFFLKPGEMLEHGIVDAYVLEDDEALILKALNEFTDQAAENIQRTPGDVWMINGPLVYIPPVEVQVQDRRKPIPLSENEGIYVQDCKTGKVKTVHGPQSYLLKETEALWEKELSLEVERMLKNGGCYGEGDIRKLAYFEVSVDTKYTSGKRDKTRAVTYRAPTNTAVQVFDHQRQTARVVFGPNLIMLGPSEEFNVLTLSAGKPKKQFALECLAIMLGPDYLSDIIEVETLDHARLRIMYAANNRFEYEVGNEDSEKQLFSVPDYIGFATRNIASRIRACVAKTSFDEFHRHSTKIITEAVFGKENKQLKFAENNMIVTNIDIQSIEPVDVHMRDSLLKSVQLAIEISTQSIEMAAEHEAAKNNQVAKGNLEKHKLDNEKAAENARMNLYSLRAVTAAVESSGQAKAEAEAQAEKLLIEGTSAIEIASLKMQAEEIEENVKLDILEKQREAEVEYTRVCNDLSVEREKQMAEIEKDKTRKLIDSIGKNTIQNIALAGPAAQFHMIKGLGIRGALITDGSTPVNLYQGANGMINPMNYPGPQQWGMDKKSEKWLEELLKENAKSAQDMCDDASGKVADVCQDS